MSSSFDEYKDRYRDEVQKSVAFLGQDVDFFTEAKVVRLLDAAAAHLGDPGRLKVLDVGCGAGVTDRFLVGRFAELHGVDLSAELVDDARGANPGVCYQHYDGTRLPFADGGFDLAFVINVLHHVPPADWPRFVVELARVVRPGGIVAAFEHNPINPLTRLAVLRCPFDEDAVLLGQRRLTRLLAGAGLQVVDRKYILFFPFRAKTLQRIERGLGWLPLGAQHFVIGRVPGEPRHRDLGPLRH